MLSRRNILSLQKRRIILVDHNERTQAVEGFEQADILEIIDHHRIGSLETTGPVYFRNQPVGSTATIVTQMYDEQGVEIPRSHRRTAAQRHPVGHSEIQQPHLHSP